MPLAVIDWGASAFCKPGMSITHWTPLAEFRFFQSWNLGNFESYWNSVMALYLGPSGTMCLGFLLLLSWNSLTKSNTGCKVYLAHISPSQFIISRNQERTQSRIPEAGFMEEYCLLVHLHAGLYLACFLIQPRTTWVGMVLPTVGWTLLHQLITRTVPTDMLAGQCDLGNFSKGFSLKCL